MENLYNYQKTLANLMYDKLNKFGFVYNISEERTGKTGTTLQTIELLDCAKVLVLTTKRAIEGWHEAIELFNFKLDITITNYESLHKLPYERFDVVVCDETHKYLSFYGDKRGAGVQYKKVKLFTLVADYVIWLSATPFANSLSQLYHPFNLTKYPNLFKDYKTFKAFWTDFGIPNEVYIGNGIMKESYSVIDEKLLIRLIPEYFVYVSRDMLGFTKANAKIHNIEVPAVLVESYKNLVEGVVELNSQPAFTVTSTKKRYALSMIESGLLLKDPFEREFIDFKIRPKMSYIIANFSKEDTVIFTSLEYELKVLKEEYPDWDIRSGIAYAEGVDLSHVANLVIYSVTDKISTFIQQRARQLNKERVYKVIVHYIVFNTASSTKSYLNNQGKQIDFKRRINMLTKHNELDLEILPPTLAVNYRSSKLPINGTYLVQKKMNGVRVRFVYDDTIGTYKAITRQGKAIQVPELCTELESITRATPIVPTGLIFDGELIIDKGHNSEFEIIKGKVISAMANNIPLTGVKCLMFDINKDLTPAITNKKKVDVLMGLFSNSKYFPLPETTVLEVHPQEVEVLEEFLYNNPQLEGFILKLSSGMDSGIRTTEWIKVVPEKRAEGTIISWEYGKNRLSKLVGSVLVKLNIDGVKYEQKVSSGLSDADRVLKDKLVGRTVTIKYRECTATSLKFPSIIL